MTNQYNMKMGIQKLGVWGAMAVEKKVIQMLTMDEIEPNNPKYLTEE